MKRILFIAALFAASVAGFTGCSKDDDKDDKNNGTEQNGNNPNGDNQNNENQTGGDNETERCWEITVNVYGMNVTTYHWGTEYFANMVVNGIKDTYNGQQIPVTVSKKVSNINDGNSCEEANGTNIY